MTTYGYQNTNDAGEPLIDAAALRVEAALDAEFDAERYYEDFPQDGFGTCDEFGCDWGGCDNCEGGDSDGFTDAEADADALAGIGWGTDEDYGYFGDSDFFGEG